MIAQAGWQAVRHPLRLAQVLRLLLRLRTPFARLLKNLVVLPKGLWLANLAARRRADHIHGALGHDNGDDRSDRQRVVRNSLEPFGDLGNVWSTI